jgi:hypothetical protein
MWGKAGYWHNPGLYADCTNFHLFRNFVFCIIQNWLALQRSTRPLSPLCSVYTNFWYTQGSGMTASLIIPICPKYGGHTRVFHHLTPAEFIKETLQRSVTSTIWYCGHCDCLNKLKLVYVSALKVLFLDAGESSTLFSVPAGPLLVVSDGLVKFD